MNTILSFSRKNRLISKAEYKSLFDKAQKVSQKYLLILHKPNQKPYARLGLVVGKRVASLAVTRNRIKRAIRESFRHQKEGLEGIDVIVIARQHCDTLNKQVLRKGMDQLWEKLQIHYQKCILTSFT